MIGFIGLGKMGSNMALNLMRSGHDVYVFARNRNSIKPVLAAGANWVESPALLAASCKVIFTIVGGPDDVETLYLGKDGMLEAASPDCVFVDMTTSSAVLARKINEACLSRSVNFLDAPVTGGVAGASAGKLTFMVGGSAPILERVRPLLDIMGSKVVHMGNSGSGQTAKSCNQIAVAGIILGATEALYHAESTGLDVDKMCDVLESGTASSVLLKALRGRLKETGDKATFSISHFIKDLRIASDAAAREKERFSTVDFCLQYCEAMEKNGDGESGLQVLLEYYKSGHGFPQGSTLLGR
ncbi:MAG: 3-hydroxyisobutyrate dehydrogenase [Candidatus Krumholzibacteriia bacterium]|jgi:3-hydroxyisobutyrate dehydrogenase